MHDSELLTASQIAGELGVPRHKVVYILTTRDIQPTRRAGITKLFPKVALKIVREELECIEARSIRSRRGDARVAVA